MYFCKNRLFASCTNHEFFMFFFCLLSLFTLGWRKMRTLNTCSGPVLVYSKGQRSAVAVEGWTEKEGERLCLDLQCGGFKSLKGHNTTEKLLFWNGSFRCENNETNIWACEKPTPPSEKQQLFIQCQGRTLGFALVSFIYTISWGCTSIDTGIVSSSQVKSIVRFTKNICLNGPSHKNNGTGAHANNTK